MKRRTGRTCKTAEIEKKEARIITSESSAKGQR